LLESAVYYYQKQTKVCAKSLHFVKLGLAYRPKFESYPAFNLVVQLLETLVGWASGARQAAIKINSPGGTGGQSILDFRF
jgi:hypothetical protein